MDDLHNIVRRMVLQTLAQFSPQSRVGTVSSYDPDTHSVKVLLQPEGKESNWIPIAVQHIGNGFGAIMCGPEIGDQMEVAFHQNDPTTARVIGRYHSDEDKPPRVESGEILIRDKHGNRVLMDKNKDMHVTARNVLNITAKDSHVNIKAAGTLNLNSGGILRLNMGETDNSGAGVA